MHTGKAANQTTCARRTTGHRNRPRQGNRCFRAANDINDHHSNCSGACECMLRGLLSGLPEGDSGQADDHGELDGRTQASRRIAPAHRAFIRDQMECVHVSGHAWEWPCLPGRHLAIVGSQCLAMDENSSRTSGQRKADATPAGACVSAGWMMLLLRCRHC
jgi:hypothetical protein